MLLMSCPTRYWYTLEQAGSPRPLFYMSSVSMLQPPALLREMIMSLRCGGRAPNPSSSLEQDGATRWKSRRVPFCLATEHSLWRGDPGETPVVTETELVGKDFTETHHHAVDEGENEIDAALEKEVAQAAEVNVVLRTDDLVVEHAVHCRHLLAVTLAVIFFFVVVVVVVAGRFATLCARALAVAVNDTIWCLQHLVDKLSLFAGSPKRVDRLNGPVNRVCVYAVHDALSLRTQSSFKRAHCLAGCPGLGSLAFLCLALLVEKGKQDWKRQIEREKDVLT